MYGIVNKALQELITENYGAENWEKIRLGGGVSVDFFASNEVFDDSVTYALAASAAKELGMDIGEVLYKLGMWWILRTGKYKYGSLLQSGGVNLQDFLINLPVFHNRVKLMFPKMTAPEFKVTDVASHSVHLHYYSKREGLQDFVKGLLSGLGELFQTPVKIELVRSREQGNNHEIFKVTWD